MSKKIKVKVKEGYKHRVAPPGYDPGAAPKGVPGPEVEGGAVIMVTEAELASFGDKFEVLQPARRGRPPKAKSAEAEAPAQD